jgi:hypothetical protein
MRWTWRGRETLSAKRYTETYARFFGDLASEEITLLEIGIDRGASLRLWEDFFPRATIHAIDINPRCNRYSSQRTTVHIGSQTDAAFLEHVVRQSGALDVVIDDGGHTMEQHAAGLIHLWAHVKPGGAYIIEDLHTAYMPEFGGGGPDSTMHRLKSVLDSLHGYPADRPIVHGVAGVWFAPSIAVLVKAPQ